MLLKPYAIGLLALIVTLPACKRLTRETVNLHITCNETLVGRTAPGGINSRFSGYTHAELLDAVEENLGNKIDARSINVVEREADADYVLVIDDLVVEDWIVEETYEDECGSSGSSFFNADCPPETVTFYLDYSSINLYGTLYNASNDISYPFAYGQTYRDKVQDCYDAEDDCTHYDEKNTSGKSALRQYGRKAGKTVKKMVWADQDAQ